MSQKNFKYHCEISVTGPTKFEGKVPSFKDGLVRRSHGAYNVEKILVLWPPKRKIPGSAPGPGRGPHVAIFFFLSLFFGHLAIWSISTIMRWLYSICRAQIGIGPFSLLTASAAPKWWMGPREAVRERI